MGCEKRGAYRPKSDNPEPLTARLSFLGQGHVRGAGAGRVDAAVSPSLLSHTAPVPGLYTEETRRKEPL
jgi:hypothetical protein